MKKTPIKNVDFKDQALNRIDTSQIIWHVIKRHKFFIVSFYAVIVTIVYVFPFIPSLLIDIVR